MNNHISFEKLISRFNEKKLKYEVISFGEDAKLVVSERGGRIFGPFVAKQQESILWVNKAFENPDTFREFLESGHWNIGGDRIWLAPEIQYNVKNRADFFGTYDLPPQIDPGNYSIKKTVCDECLLTQDMIIEVCHDPQREKKLSISRLIRKVDDPLRELSEFNRFRDTVFIGYEQEITLEEEVNDGVYSEAWNLTQLNPGGTLYVSLYTNAQYTDYYLPIDSNYQTVGQNYARLRVTGDRKYKVGYKSSCVTGRLGYFNTLKDGRHYLLVRNFFNNPSAQYTKEPADLPGCKGHSVHIYNDDGGLGGFGELECSCQAIGGSSGRNKSIGQIISWIYLGDKDVLNKVSLHLLGAELEDFGRKD